MAGIPPGVAAAEYGELPVVARRVLLDGIEALRDHRDAITVVGAQAVYLRSADVNLAIPTFTTDADFSIDPEHLDDAPLLEQAVGSAGFFLRNPDQPGLWAKYQAVGHGRHAIGLDLLVGETFAGKGRRAAQLPPHGRRVARRVDGIEATVVDADVLWISSLEPDCDPRVVPARVAGPAALLVAKAHKIAERVAEGRANRVDDKDAGDVVRLLLAVDVEETADRMAALLADPRVVGPTVHGLRHLHRLFAGRSSVGTEMARRSLAGDRNQNRVHEIVRLYLERLPRPS